MLCRLNVTSLFFSQFMANLQPFGSRIPDVLSIKLTFLLTATFHLTRTENRTKKYLEHSSHTFALKVMKRAASSKHRQAAKTIQCEKKLFKSHLGK